MFTTFIEPIDWALKIPNNLSSSIWLKSQAHSTNWSKWNAYINKLCLEACLIWIRAEHCSTATAWLEHQNAAAFHEFFNGFAITIGSAKLVMIPTEAIDQTSIDVPQEWVDIPSMAADYYLAVQVDIENNEIRIYGYTTHQNLKTLSIYDSSDRTYCFDTEDLNADLNALWLSYPNYTTSQTRSAIAPIPSITAIQADSLIARLGNAAELFPRLEVPFQQWAAIMENNEWRQRIYQQRRSEQSNNLVTILNSWFAGQIDTMWQAIDQVLLPQQIAGATRNSTSSIPTVSDQEIYRAKVLSFKAGLVALVMKISPLENTESRIILQIHPAGGNQQLPSTTQLRLLSIDNQEIGLASAAAMETIQLQFRANLGEQFQTEITCDGQTLTERFEL
jgi:hypothetical protein